jgi:DNA-binding NarL/FixJ family response regulator
MNMNCDARGPTRFAPDLKKRELDVLQLIAIGMTNKEIAEMLRLGLPTVKWSATRIFRKLNVRNRVQAAIAAAALPQTVFRAYVAPADPKPESLRRHERKILELISVGMTNTEIATRLGLTRGTVTWYIGELYGKLHLRNRVAALLWARDRGIWTTDANHVSRAR